MTSSIARISLFPLDGPKTALSPSAAKLLREVKKIRRDDVVPVLGRNCRGFSRTALLLPVNVGGSQPGFPSGLEIVFVGGDHHDLLGLEIKQLRRQLVDRRVGLVALHILRRENAVPWQA